MSSRPDPEPRERGVAENLGAVDENGIRIFRGPVMWTTLAVSVLILVVIGWAIDAGMQRYVLRFDALSLVSPAAAFGEALAVLRGIGIVMGGLAIASAGFALRASRKVVSARQIPPPGSWVLGRPRVVRGRRAVLIGRVGIVAAGVLAFVGLTTIVLVWHLSGLLISGFIDP